MSLRGSIRQAVKGTLNSFAAAINNMRINFRGGNVRVPQQLLNGTYVVSVFKQMGGKTMTKAVYSQAYNRRHNKVGHLFQGRYKAILVDEDAYLLELVRYIVLNPVKAMMVKEVEDWKWSSYRATTGESPSPGWLSVDSVLAQFSPQRKRAIQKYKAFVTDGLKNGPIWAQLNHQIYLGDAEFVEQMQTHLKNDQADVQIPKIQKRSVPKPLMDYESEALNRDQAITEAYASGGYSYQEIGDYFGLHFTRVGKIVRDSRNSGI